MTLFIVSPTHIFLGYFLRPILSFFDLFSYVLYKLVSALGCCDVIRCQVGFDSLDRLDK